MLGDIRSCSPEKSCLQPTIHYLALFMNHLSPIPSQETNYYSYRTLINSRLYWPDPVILFPFTPALACDLTIPFRGIMCCDVSAHSPSNLARLSDFKYSRSPLPVFLLGHCQKRIPVED